MNSYYCEKCYKLTEDYYSIRAQNFCRLCYLSIVHKNTNQEYEVPDNKYKG